MANPYRTPSIESQAIGYAQYLIARGASDWQEVQAALAEKAEFSEWLGDDVAGYQSVIRKAEARFNGQLPETYSE